MTLSRPDYPVTKSAAGMQIQIVNSAGERFRITAEDLAISLAQLAASQEKKDG